MSIRSYAVAIVVSALSLMVAPVGAQQTPAPQPSLPASTQPEAPSAQPSAPATTPAQEQLRVVPAKHFPGKVHLLPATMETTQWGWFNNAQPPVLHVNSGDTIVFETMMHSHNQVVPGTTIEQIKKLRTDYPGRGPHTLTGPVYIEGAEPGDVLKVRITRSCLALTEPTSMCRACSVSSRPSFPMGRSSISISISSAKWPSSHPGSRFHWLRSPASWALPAPSPASTARCRRDGTAAISTFGTKRRAARFMSRCSSRGRYYGPAIRMPRR